jgi:hypothetical protein
MRAIGVHGKPARTSGFLLVALYCFEPTEAMSVLEIAQCSIRHDDGARGLLTGTSCVRPSRGVGRRISGLGGRAIGRSTTPCRHHSSYRIELPFGPLLWRSRRYNNIVMI